MATVIADVEGSDLAYELNVLDNASGDDLTDLAIRFDACRTFVSPRNLGFGGGHNLLATKTSAAHLLILNPDVEFMAPASVSRLLEVVLGGEQVAAVGPKLVTASGDPQPYDHGRLHGFRAQIALRGGHSYWRPAEARQEVAWVSGATLLVARQAFTHVQGFDDKLFLYKEDEDLCLRLRGNGGRVIYDPVVVVRHQGSVVADRRESLARSSAYFFDKHFPNERSRSVFAAAHQALAYIRL